MNTKQIVVLCIGILLSAYLAWNPPEKKDYTRFGDFPIAEYSTDAPLLAMRLGIVVLATGALCFALRSPVRIRS